MQLVASVLLQGSSLLLPSYLRGRSWQRSKPSFSWVCGKPGKAEFRRCPQLAGDAAEREEEQALPAALQGELGERSDDEREQTTALPWAANESRQESNDEEEEALPAASLGRRDGRTDDDEEAANVKPARTTSGGGRLRPTIGWGCGGGEASPTESKEEETLPAAPLGARREKRR